MRTLITLSLASILLSAVPLSAGDNDMLEKCRAEAYQKMRDGLYREAWELYSPLVLDPANSSADNDLLEAINCAAHLDQPFLSEQLIEEVFAKRMDNPLLASTAAFALALHIPHEGRIIDGEFVRSLERNGKYAQARERDRARAIVAMLEAEKTALSNNTLDKKGLSGFYRKFAAIVADGRVDNDAWLFTSMTPLDPLPDYDTSYAYYRRRGIGAPVDKDGNPIFYSVPSSWNAAENDGQRWRWLLSRQAHYGEQQAKDDTDRQYAEFLLGQFGVQTILQYPQPRPMRAGSDASADEDPYSVKTLSENETIARLASGIRRISLPDEHNYIMIMRRLIQSGSIHMIEANRNLAQVFENRQQYEKAAQFWRNILDKDDDDEQAKEALQRIVGSQGDFETIANQPAGSKARIPYVFRNGKSLKLTAYKLNEKAFLNHIKDTLKSGDFENNRSLSPEQIGIAAAKSEMKNFIQEKTAEWAVGLDPLPGHYSRRITIEMPFDQAGAYLVLAQMENGNLSRIILWQSDLALVEKTIGSEKLYFVADAVTGKPAAKAKLSFFGYNLEYRDHNNKPSVVTKEFAEFVGEDGMLLLPTEKFDRLRWLTLAETEDKRLAYLGFTNIWGIALDIAPDQRPGVYAITDRPVYKPDEKVHFKIWAGNRSYTGDSPLPAGTGIKIRIDNPMGDAVYEKTLATDANGGVEDMISLDGSAVLGAYHLSAYCRDGSSSSVFRLEEYKVPEFEVSVVTPEETTKLGDTVKAVISAKYYFGAPVTSAKVSYRITRTAHSFNPFPPTPWDWLYGDSYWRGDYDYAWLPGWQSWGTSARIPSYGRYSPPEVVMEGEGELDDEGKLIVTFDTKSALETFGNQDHRYDISAEITDSSRRVITGSGSVIAARKPFAVTLWLDRGFYQAGNDAVATVRVQSPQGKGVETSGEVKLYRIRYGSHGKTSEEEIESWPLSTDAGGAATLRFRADASGQYRISYIAKAKDSKNAKEAIEGARVFTIRGDTEQAGDFRYNSLELIPDKKQYTPGDTMRLAVNSHYPTATVLLFPTNTSYAQTGNQKPLQIALQNGSYIHSQAIGVAEQPNFFCEAITIFEGKMYSEVVEVFVPPAEKTLNVQIVPDKTRHLPGGKAEFTISVTGPDGKPVSGQAVVAMYDKAVEYISGGSNVPDIRSAFWSWKRYYSPYQQTSLSRSGRTIKFSDEPGWQPIGVFGRQEMDWNGMNDVGGDLYGSGGEVEMVMEAPMAAMAFASDAAPATPAPAPRQAVAKARTREQAAPTSGGGMAEAEVRNDFAGTALWLAALEIDSSGKATVTVDLPDNLTTWKTRVWTKASATRVGEASVETVTAKNIIIRPQMPRFLTQKDEVVLSANVHNYLPRGKDATVEISLEGGILVLIDAGTREQKVSLAAGGEARVEWRTKAARPGLAKLRFRILTDEESDAAELTLPVIIHGSRRVESYGSVLRPGTDAKTFTITVPAERLAERSRLEFSFSSTLASTMLDAIPYLVEYPYGCTEQTLNRFLPAVMARKYLEDLGLSLEDANKESKETRYGSPYRNDKNPVFDAKELEKIVKEGVSRLADMQNSDGGWGWFSGTAEVSWPHTTAVIMHGLLAAQECGVAIPSDVIERGIGWLQDHQAGEIERLKNFVNKVKDSTKKEKAANMDAFIYMILAGNGSFNPDMRDFLYRDRLDLSLSALAMFGVALHEEKATNALDMVLRNLAQFVEANPDNQTAWLRLPSDGWWWWYNDEIETLAWYLKLLSRTDPRGDATAAVGKYLIENRKNATYWRSTRDTAYAIEAIVDYAKASGETASKQTVKVYYDGKLVMERDLDATNLLENNAFVLEGVAVEEGTHEIRIERNGIGNLYTSGRLDVFSLADPIPAAAGNLKIGRKFYRLVREDATNTTPDARGKAVHTDKLKYRREAMPSPFDTGAPVTLSSGDLVEVELTIEAANDYEYLCFEDMKAAGLEAVELRSGYSYDNLRAYVEYRNDKVVLFVRSLPRGKHNLSYRFRAETPGSYSALPTVGGGMYATDLVANSDEMKIAITE